jgi:hypothetical protein
LIGWKWLRRATWVIWLAVAALGLNGLMPIHLAFDLGEALRLTQHAACQSGRRGLEWRLFALAIGHDAGDSKPDADHHHPTCPAFAALGALAGFAKVAAPTLPLPATIEQAPAFAFAAGKLAPIPAAAYRSRAPPLG